MFKCSLHEFEKMARSVEKAKNNFLGLLGLPKCASEGDIIDKFLKKAMLVHPEKDGRPEATDQFRKLSHGFYNFLNFHGSLRNYNLWYCSTCKCVHKESCHNYDTEEEDYSSSDDFYSDEEDDETYLDMFYEILREAVFRHQFASKKKRKKHIPVQGEEEQKEFYDLLLKKRNAEDDPIITEEDLKKFHSYDEWRKARDPRKRPNHRTRKAKQKANKPVLEKPKQFTKKQLLVMQKKREMEAEQIGTELERKSQEILLKECTSKKDAHDCKDKSTGGDIKRSLIQKVSQEMEALKLAQEREAMRAAEAVDAIEAKNKAALRKQRKKEAKQMRKEMKITHANSNSSNDSMEDNTLRIVSCTANTSKDTLFPEIVNPTPLLPVRPSVISSDKMAAESLKEERNQQLQSFLAKVKQHRLKQTTVTSEGKDKTESEVDINLDSGRDQKRELLNKHLQQYKELMSQQPCRHTEEQLRQERRQKQREMEVKHQKEVERLRLESKVYSCFKFQPSVCSDTYEQQQELMRLERNKDASVDPELLDIEERYGGLKADYSKVTKKNPKQKVITWKPLDGWSTGLPPEPVHKPIVRPDLPRPAAPPVVNAWKERKELLESLRPTDQDDEEEMLRQALELSQQEAVHEQERCLQAVEAEVKAERLAREVRLAAARQRQQDLDSTASILEALMPCHVNPAGQNKLNGKSASRATKLERDHTLCIPKADKGKVLEPVGGQTIISRTKPSHFAAPAQLPESAPWEEMAGEKVGKLSSSESLEQTDGNKMTNKRSSDWGRYRDTEEDIDRAECEMSLKLCEGNRHGDGYKRLSDVDQEVVLKMKVVSDRSNTTGACGSGWITVGGETAGVAVGVAEVKNREGDVTSSAKSKETKTRSKRHETLSTLQVPVVEGATYGSPALSDDQNLDLQKALMKSLGVNTFGTPTEFSPPVTSEYPGSRDEDWTSASVSRTDMSISNQITTGDPTWTKGEESWDTDSDHGNSPPRVSAVDDTQTLLNTNITDVPKTPTQTPVEGGGARPKQKIPNWIAGNLLDASSRSLHKDVPLVEEETSVQSAITDNLVTSFARESETFVAGVCASETVSSVRENMLPGETSETVSIMPSVLPQPNGQAQTDVNGGIVSANNIPVVSNMDVSHMQDPGFMAPFPVPQPNLPLPEMDAATIAYYQQLYSSLPANALSMSGMVPLVPPMGGAFPLPQFMPPVGGCPPLLPLLPPLPLFGGLELPSLDDLQLDLGSLIGGGGDGGPMADIFDSSGRLKHTVDIGVSGMDDAIQEMNNANNSNNSEIGMHQDADYEVENVKDETHLNITDDPAIICYKQDDMAEDEYLGNSVGSFVAGVAVQGVESLEDYVVNNGEIHVAGGENQPPEALPIQKRVKDSPFVKKFKALNNKLEFSKFRSQLRQPRLSTKCNLASTLHGQDSLQASGDDDGKE